MFRITKNGVSIGMTEAPNYIRKAENGSFVLCPEPEASGIAFAGVQYHLLGRPELPNLETVMLEATDAGAEIVKTSEAGSIMFVTMAEAGSIDAVPLRNTLTCSLPGHTRSIIRSATSGAMVRSCTAA